MKAFSSTQSAVLAMLREMLQPDVSVVPPVLVPVPVLADVVPSGKVVVVVAGAVVEVTSAGRATQFSLIPVHG
jgi:hypothetical protein